MLIVDYACGAVTISTISMEALLRRHVNKYCNKINVLFYFIADVVSRAMK